MMALMHGHWGKQFDEVEVELWRQMLQSWDYADAEEAVAIWADQEHEYAPKPMELLKVVKRLAWGKAQEGVRGTLMCDGTRWIQHTTGAKPCPSCNPMLYQVWLEPDEWQRFLHGTPLEDLHPGVRRVGGKLVADGPLPPACQLSSREDPQDPVPQQWDQALAAIKRGYWEELEQYGLSEAEIEAGWRRHYRPRDNDMPDVFASVDEGIATSDPYQTSTARPEETAAVLEAIRGGARHYSKIQEVVGHRVAQRSLRRLEQDGLITWAANGDLSIRRRQPSLQGGTDERV